MTARIQLQHPAGKKAVSMETGKYESLKAAILKSLKEKGKATHTEMLEAVTQNLSTNNTPFNGSIAWHMEWVKLDLEARQEIERMQEQSPVKYKLV